MKRLRELLAASRKAVKPHNFHNRCLFCGSVISVLTGATCNVWSPGCSGITCPGESSSKAQGESKVSEAALQKIKDFAQFPELWARETMHEEDAEQREQSQGDGPGVDDGSEVFGVDLSLPVEAIEDLLPLDPYYSMLIAQRADLEGDETD